MPNHIAIHRVNYHPLKEKSYSNRRAENHSSRWRNYWLWVIGYWLLKPISVMFNVQWSMVNEQNFQLSTLHLPLTLNSTLSTLHSPNSLRLISELISQIEFLDLLHVVLDHNLDQLFEAGLLGIPAQLLLGLRRVAQ